MADSDKGQREKVSEVRQTGRGRQKGLGVLGWDGGLGEGICLV